MRFRKLIFPSLTSLTALILFLGVLALALAGASPALTAGLLNLPDQPVSVVHSPWLSNLPYSTFAITLSNVPEGFDVTNGVYNGWCIEDNHQDDPPVSESILVELTGDPWGNVNWLLNNRQGYDGYDVQIAIWLLLGTNQSPVTTDAQTLYEAALGHADFIASPGEVVAVLSFGDNNGGDMYAGRYQDTIIEVEVPAPPPPSFVFSGHVYQGEVGDTSTPLAGVTVELFGSPTNDPNAGVLLGSSATDPLGAFEITISGDTYPYYFLIETNPAGYLSVGAQSIAGSVVNADTIQFASPLAGLDLSGNNFWDQLLPPSFVFTGNVYQGELGDTTTPLAGVTVGLFGANLPYPVQNPTLLDTAITGSDGAYSLELNGDTYRYYFIIEQNLPGYISVGAQSIAGEVVTVDQIQFTSPVADQNRTGNNFWDNLTEAPFVFSGYVYLGQVFDITQPIGGINIRLYGSTTPYPDLSGATLLAITQTNLDGSFNLLLNADTYPYYFITEQTPFGYFSAGAWTNDGSVMDNDTIQFTSPLSGKDLSGNLFWDDISACLVSFTGMVYEGELNDVSKPLAGVLISLYGSNTPNLGDAVLIENAYTDEGGTYRIPIQRDDYAYYFLVQQNLAGYISVGVKHYSGETISSDIVRFTSPLPGQNLSAIRFWDLPSADSLTFSGRVFMGEPEVNQLPLSGKLVNLYGIPAGGSGPVQWIDSDLTNHDGAYTLTYAADHFDSYLVVLQTEEEVLQFQDLAAGSLVTGADLYIPFPYRYYIPVIGTK